MKIKIAKILSDGSLTFTYKNFNLKSTNQTFISTIDNRNFIFYKKVFNSKNNYSELSKKSITKYFKL
jgi:hypothetical protein